MRKAAVIVLFLVKPSWAAITLTTNTISWAVDGVGTSTTTKAINTTGATLLVMGVSYFAGGSALAVSDSKANTWTKLAISSGSSGAGSTVIYVSSNPIVGSGHTFTESATNSFPGLAVAAFSGALLTGNPFDVQSGAVDNNTGATTLQTGSVTPSQDNELLVTVYSNNTTSAATYTIDSGFTITDQVNPAGGFYYGTGFAYLINGAGTSGVAVNPKWTSTSGTMSTRIATFQAAAVAASTTVCPSMDALGIGCGL